DQYAEFSGASFHRRFLAGLPWLFRDPWQTHREFGALVESSAFCLDRTPVQFDQLLDQRETDAEAFVQLPGRLAGLREQMANNTQLIGGDSYAVIPYGSHSRVFLLLEHGFDTPPR